VIRTSLLLTLVLLAGCQREPPSGTEGGARNGEIEQGVGGAVSTAPIEPVPDAAPAMFPPSRSSGGTIDWSPLQLAEESVALSCTLDYQHAEDVPITDFSQESLHQALRPCAEQGLVRIRYQGRIGPGLASVVERIAVTADELGIDKRVLDLDSAGGQIEEAIRAGDYIAESRWTIWVREDAICHSACVLILGAGDRRVIAGTVGIHRIIRMSSTATTRAELSAELNAVYQRVRAYLERNGVSVAVADLMMAVPNRRLRLLTSDELRLYGLDGVNAVQDDLDRLRLLRKCGEDFVKRRDSFLRAFERRCQSDGEGIVALNECGLELRTSFGFPDAVCPAESPLSEFDSMVVAKPVDRAGDPAPGEDPEDTADAGDAAGEDDDQSGQPPQATAAEQGATDPAS
jgi:ATP-dependent protease ClpP protease subunit